MKNNSIQLWIEKNQLYVNQILNQFIPLDTKVDKLLHNAIRYVSLNVGKRIRPLLCIAASFLGTTNLQALQQFFCAIEFIHIYSLVHDDMPIMDNDIIRHSKPTCHMKYNQETALLVGDSLQSLAFEVISINISNFSYEQQLNAINILANAIGSQGMAGGQSIDVQNINKNISLQELKLMHYLKTGKLIETAVVLGYLSCNNYDSSVIHHLQAFGNNIGLAFQIIDDILDTTTNSKVLGKSSGKDELYNKPNFVSFMGADKAKNYANELINQAKENLTQFEKHKANYLLQLADFILYRQF